MCLGLAVGMHATASISNSMHGSSNHPHHQSDVLQFDMDTKFQENT